MAHVVLLGDSVFDDAADVGHAPEVRQQTEQALSSIKGKVTLLARDGAVIAGIAQQLRMVPRGASHLVVSVGGNDVLPEAGVLEATASSVADALQKLAVVGDIFNRAYASMLDEVSKARLPTAVCTI